MEIRDIQRTRLRLGKGNIGFHRIPLGSEWLTNIPYFISEIFGCTITVYIYKYFWNCSTTGTVVLRNTGMV